jgi:hypothetical protein
LPSLAISNDPTFLFICLEPLASDIHSTLVKKREFLKVLGKTQSEAVMRYGAEHERI